jgi:hypothetical protein
VKYPFIALILLFSLHTTAQSIDSVFARYIRFLGGKQRLQSIHSRIDSGTYNYGGIEFPFVSWAQSPDRYKYIVTFNGKYFTQAFDGQQGWKIDAFKNEKQKTLLYGDNARSMANEADVQLEPLFIDYKKKGYTATLDGTDTVDGTPCHRIKLTQPNGPPAIFFFDQQTGALLKKIAIAQNRELNGATLDIFYSDYTDIQGIRIPFKTIHKIKDQPVLTITLKNSSLNPPVGEEIFKP